jgi:hypothetical protein
MADFAGQCHNSNDSVCPELNPVSRSTAWHRARGRPTRKEKAARQQYLTPSEETAVVEYLLKAADNGFPIHVKALAVYSLPDRKAT